MIYMYLILIASFVYGPQIIQDAKQAPARWGRVLHLKRAPRQQWNAPYQFDRPDSTRSVVPDSLSSAGREFYLLGLQDLERMRALTREGLRGNHEHLPRP